MSPEEIKEALKEVLDPEMGVNVVDLGLIYGVVVEGESVHVDLTMTSAACPMGAHLKDEVAAAVRRYWPDVEGVTVDLVWDPPWSPQLMTEDAKRILGW